MSVFLYTAVSLQANNTACPFSLHSHYRRIEQTLEQAERELSELAADTIDFALPPYDLDYLCNIHHQLFSDLYDWAGSLRTIDIVKGNTRVARQPA